MMANTEPRMTAEDAAWLMRLFERNGLEVVIDGGWGVDALLGEQTRSHADLDIVIEYQDVRQLRRLLEENGFTDVPRPDTREVNFVMGDIQGRLVDIHTYTLDRENLPEQGLDYPLDSLHGSGSILGYPVRCIDVENMVKFHSGYAIDENDYHDVKALCVRFGLPLPDEFSHFADEEKSHLKK
jgi:lincosamide nucleotidyltransferase A/C/D/E